MFKTIFGREDNKKFTKNETGKKKNTDTSYRNDLVL